MTTSSVRNVGGLLGQTGVQPGNANKSADDSFLNIWNNQAGQKKTDVDIANGKPKNTRADADSTLRTKENARKDLSEADEKSVSGKDGEISKDSELKACELAGEQAMQLINRIAEVFQVPVSDVEALLAENGLQPVDLLNTDKLGQVLLQLKGVDSALALLTDEGLYSDYQMLLDQSKDILRECSELLGVSTEEFSDMIQNAIAGMEEGEDVGSETNLDNRLVTDESAAIFETDGSTTVQESDRSRDGSFKGSDENAAGHQNPNLMFHNPVNTDTAAPAQRVEGSIPAWSSDTTDMMQQILDYMRVSVKPDVSNLEMQLHPASLGSLHIHVASEGGVVTANFIAENENVKAILESQLIQLKESFAEQGVSVEAIEVSVQANLSEQNLEQGRNGQQDGNFSRTRTRRIRLDGADGTGIPEDLDERDQMTAEVMAANGQTVDYTA